MINRALGRADAMGTQSPFPDVPLSHWACGAIRAATSPFLKVGVFMYTFPPAGHTKAGESEVSSMSNENNNRKNAQNQAQNQKKGESAQNKKREQAQNKSERQQQF